MSDHNGAGVDLGRIIHDVAAIRIEIYDIPCNVDVIGDWTDLLEEISELQATARAQLLPPRIPIDITASGG
jgi:hypothetical protein